MGIDPEQALDEAIRADNACLEGARRAGRDLAMHLCRGNNRSHWYAEGGYDAIAEKLFGQCRSTVPARVRRRARGTFEPLRFMPRGKTVVLGLVSSKLAELESADELARRIEEAATYVPLENLALSRSAASPRRWRAICSPRRAVAKLKLVVDTAVKVWGRA